MAQRNSAAEALNYMQRESPGLKICVSAGPVGSSAGGALGQFASLDILPFEEIQAGQLLALLTGTGEPEIRRQVAAMPQLGPLAGNPLMFRLLSLYADRHGLEFPSSRLQLFEDLADAMLAGEQRAAPRQISIRALHRGHEIAAESLAAKGTPTLPVAELAAALTHDADDTITEEDAGLFLCIAALALLLPLPALSALACSVHVGAMVDAYNVDSPGGLVDPVDHPVRAAPRRVVPGQFTGERSTHPVRIVQQCARQELGHRRRDRHRQSAWRSLGEDPPGGRGQRQGVRLVAHPASRSFRTRSAIRRRSSSAPMASPRAISASAVRISSIAPGVDSRSRVSSMVSRSDTEMITASGRPLRVITTRSCVSRTSSSTADSRALASARGIIIVMT
jgi:hypothetical protein